MKKKMKFVNAIGVYNFIDLKKIKELQEFC